MNSQPTHYYTAADHWAEERDRLTVRLQRLAAERHPQPEQDLHYIAYLREREAALRESIDARLGATRYLLAAARVTRGQDLCTVVVEATEHGHRTQSPTEEDREDGTQRPGVATLRRGAPRRGRRVHLEAEESGSSQAEIAQELGLSHRTLWGWLRRERRSVVRPVELIDDHTETEPPVWTRALVFPNGSRIEGLSLDDVVTLVRALS